MKLKVFTFIGLFACSLHANVSSQDDLKENFFGMKYSWLSEAAFNDIASKSIEKISSLETVQFCLNNASNINCLKYMIAFVSLNEAMVLSKCSSSKKVRAKLEQEVSSLKEKIEKIKADGNLENVNTNHELEAIRRVSNDAAQNFYKKLSYPRTFYIKLAYFFN